MVADKEPLVARAFHEAAKHSYLSVRRDQHFLDWEDKPLLYKIYPALLPIPFSVRPPVGVEDALKVIGGYSGLPQGDEPGLDTPRPCCGKISFRRDHLTPQIRLVEGLFCTTSRISQAHIEV